MLLREAVCEVDGLEPGEMVQRQGIDGYARVV